MFGLGIPELLVVLAIVLLLFGTKRLPTIARDLGKSVRELKDGFTDGNDDKSLKDIAKEVNTSTQAIKKEVNSVKNTGFYKEV